MKGVSRIWSLSKQMVFLLLGSSVFFWAYGKKKNPPSLNRCMVSVVCDWRRTKGTGSLQSWGSVLQRPGSKAATENRLPIRAAATTIATCLMLLPRSCPQLLQLHWLMLRYVAPLIATLLVSISNSISTHTNTHTQKGANWLATYHKSIL